MKINLNQILEENSNNKEFISFIKENQINEKILSTHYDLIQEYLISYHLCKKREDIAKCQQKVPGYRLKLVINSNQKITKVLTDCIHTINNLKEKEETDNFLIRHYPNKLLSLSLSQNFITTGKARLEVLNYSKEYLKLNTNDYPGLYLHGDTGVGKTYIFILLANKLIQKNYTVAFVIWSEFINEIKANFENNSDKFKKLEKLKNSDFLFIDDLGGESISTWERDELLFPILNARTLPLKTTFINSNYSLNELAQCYTLKRDKLEEVKVKRLIDRIKKLTKTIRLTNFKN